VAREQEYPFEQTLEEAGPERIQTFQNHEEDWSKSVLTQAFERMNNT